MTNIDADDAVHYERISALSQGTMLVPLQTSKAKRVHTFVLVMQLIIGLQYPYSVAAILSPIMTQWNNS